VRGLAKQGLFQLVFICESTALFCLFSQNIRPKTTWLLKSGGLLVKLKFSLVAGAPSLLSALSQQPVGR
jgi:hypothetical protein